ncbi:MAG TPA: hypothetical protein DEA28_01250 [Firmicutes bacterium]|nr:hypothetical protein [Bacillota bacterium]
MLKNKNIILLVSSFLLVSCGKVESKVRSLDEMYSDLEQEIALSGTLLMLNYDTNQKEYAKDEGQMGVAFGSNSYYLSSNFFDSDITLWKNNDGYAVTYDLDRDNKIVENTFLDNNKNPISFDNYENPFLTNYKSYLVKDENSNSYSIPTTSNLNKSKIKEIMKKVANINLPDVNSFVLTYKDYKFDTLTVTTPKISTDNGYYYDLSISLSFDLSSKDKDIPIPTPLKHESYHDTLLKAFNYLEDGKYSFTMELIDNSDESSSKTYYYYEAVDTDFVYQGSLDSLNSTKSTMEVGYYLVNDKESEGVDKGVHELLLLNDNSYGYYSTVPNYNNKPITDIKRYTPYRATAVESFIKRDNNIFTMSTSQVSSFATNITKFINLNLSGTNDIELTLNDDNKIDTMHFLSEYYEVNLTYDYSSDAFNKLGFRKEDLKPVDGYSLYNGTYKFNFKKEDVTLVISGTLKNPTITWNGNNVTFDGTPYFPTLNQIYFIYNGNSFYLKEATTQDGKITYLVGCFDGPDSNELEVTATRS